jgi:hypothetical protein
MATNFPLMISRTLRNRRSQRLSSRLRSCLALGRRAYRSGFARVGISAATTLIIIIVAFSAYTAGIIKISTPPVIQTTTVSKIQTAGTYTATVTLSNQSQRVFNGTWSGGSAQVAVTGAQLLAAGVLSSGSSTFTCASSPSRAYVALTNLGAVSVSFATISFGRAGGRTTYPVAGPCSLGASGSPTSNTYLIFPASTKTDQSPIFRDAFAGTLILSNGAQILFTGTWQ